MQFRRLSPWAMAIPVLLGFALVLPLVAQDQIVLPAAHDGYVRSDWMRTYQNYGCNPSIGVGTDRNSWNNPADGMRGLAQFDLSTIPGPPTSATLEMTVYTFINQGPGSPETFQLNIHRILGPWVEGNGVEFDPVPAGVPCLWVDFSSGVAWTGNGSTTQNQPAFDPTVFASLTVTELTLGPGQYDPPPGTVLKWDVTQLVNYWLAHPGENYGLMFRDPSTNGNFRQLMFGGREGRMYEAAFEAAGNEQMQDGPRLVLKFVVPITIDIKPDSAINSINLASAGVVPVAILSTSAFDATTVLPDSVSMAGASVKMVGKSGKYLCQTEDINGDGRTDLLCHILTAQMMMEPGESVAVLEATTVNGTKVRGEDSIRIIP